MDAFLKDLLFYDMEKNSYNKNRFTFGIDFPRGKLGAPTIYYKYDVSLSDEKWVTAFAGLVFQITL